MGFFWSEKKVQYKTDKRDKEGSEGEIVRYGIRHQAWEDRKPAWQERLTGKVIERERQMELEQVSGGKNGEKWINGAEDGEILAYIRKREKISA